MKEYKNLSFNETIIKIFKSIYSKNPILQKRYKTSNDFINSLLSTKNANEFLEIMRDVDLS